MSVNQMNESHHKKEHVKISSSSKLQKNMLKLSPKEETGNMTLQCTCTSKRLVLINN